MKKRPKPFKTDVIIILVLVLTAAAVVYAVSGKRSAPAVTCTAAAEVTAADYNAKDKKIGILSGTNYEQATFDNFPESEYLYYKNYADLNTALLNGAIDAYLGDEPALKSIHASQPQVDFIKKRITNLDCSFAFRKNDPEEAALCKKLNDFLAKANADGTIAEIDAIWFGSDESKKVVDMSGLTGENGTVRVVTTTTDEPFSYIKDNKNVGYDIDVCVRFCREYGYALELGDVDFPARIPALASGKYDFTTSMNVTPEREEEVLFSDPVSTGGTVVAVRAADLAGSSGQPKASDYDGKTVGIKTGSSFEPVTLETFPNSKYLYFDNTSDLVTALQSRKIDLFIEDEPVAREIAAQQEDLDCLSPNILDEDYSFAFKKGSEQLLERFNGFIAECSSSGRLEELKKKWSGADEAAKKPVKPASSGENGSITVAVISDLQPFSYIKDNELVGYSVELITEFADSCGYKLVFEQTNAAGSLAGVSGGKYDLIAGPVSVTEERKQTMDFSDPIYSGGMTAVVRAEDITGAAAAKEEDRSLWEEIKSGIEKNFIREERWKLIVQGIGTTCLITLLSVVFGTVLAFSVCMLRRTGSRLANVISDIYVRLLQGTPMVVLLMILYYIVFGRSGLPAVWVAVIGFTLNFGAYVSEIMRSGIESIDGGQREAALALGYTENKAFFKFIFPQAAVRQLPVYRGEVISLLKSTSVVGYIAIQDLTKMSDIIRSRTYEAFFPLIITAVIYFILAWLLTLLLKLLLRQIDPRKHKRPAAKEAE